jgi:hypothetical protein
MDWVEYTKTDIEAAELTALKGAADTIRRFRPIHIIAVYHQISDFSEIPRDLSEQTQNYSFFQDRSTIHQEETFFWSPLREPEI